MKACDTAKRNAYYHCLEYDHDQIGDIYLIACGQEECDPGVTYGPDRRDGYHLHIVCSGKGVLKTNDKVFQIHQGQMFLLKHGETVQYTSDRNEPWKYCWMTFNGSEAKDISEAIGFGEKIYCLDLNLDTELFYDLIRRMMLFPELNLISKLRRRGILLEFLALAMQASGVRDSQYAEEWSTEKYIRKAEDFIRYNYATIQVADIVKYTGFFFFFFTTAFRQKTGLSPKDYLTKVRIEKAKSLLDNTGLLIREVAEKAGYPDSLHFSRTFHEYSGMTPTQYRNRKK